MSNFWNQEDSISEFDLLQDSLEDGEEQVVEYEDIDDGVVDEIQEESSFELDEEEVSVIYNARLRLEQARLYEMLINHNLFDGVDADEQAVQNVQNELKEYIVYRLEILLGLRKPKAVVRQEQEQAVDERLNDVEVDFLKQLAYKGTRGASVQSEAPTVRQQPSTLNTMGSPKTKKNALKTLAAPVKEVKKVVKKTVKKTVAKNKSQAPATKKVVKKTTRKTKKVGEPVIQKSIKSSVGVRQLTPQEIEALAKEDLQISKSKKKWTKMSAKEKAAEVKKVNERHSRTKAVGAVPIPSSEQQEMIYTTQQQRRLQGSGNEMAKFNMMVANALAAKKQLGD